ncbi:MAG: peptidase [Candidatus Altiarchaeales archaeon HGW-Altiarchaeales-3]|nr:MAG: peptidase [Candidatus Altiarchaeales archaeon HGW-Altiarchaeales-3]
MLPLIKNIGTTKDIEIPKDPLARVVGQERAVKIAKLAAKQRRHLLLVGPPGIGKSMIAQALALHIPKPTQQVSVVHNPQNPERPLIEILLENQVKHEGVATEILKGTIINPKEAPTHIAERMGFRCTHCGYASSAEMRACPGCGANKYGQVRRHPKASPFGDIITEVFDMNTTGPENRIQTTRVMPNGRSETVIFQRDGNNIRVIDQKTIEVAQKLNNKRLNKKVLIPLKRNTFIHATGASETELLGDVRHDPYGGHREIGTPPYKRVVAGAIHEAHEGVLFVDELPHLEYLQNFILTAMQEKKFPIVGKNPSSTGASVVVKNVPCSFIFVGACNLNELNKILPPLRSRISGSGYEVLLETAMPDTEENEYKLAQFIAQEINIDGKIPHAAADAVNAIIKVARNKALKIDSASNALTTRFRDLSGIIRLAGDLAVLNESEFIDNSHVKAAIHEAKPIEVQIKERYGSMWKGAGKDSFLESDDEGASGSYR